MGQEQLLHSRVLPGDPTTSAIVRQDGNVAGERAIYAHREGTESYFWNAEPLPNWESENRPKILRPPVSAYLQYFFNPDDLDADRTYNATHADMDFILTMKNYPGLSGGNATVETAGYYPTLVKPCFNGRDGIDFRGTLQTTSVITPLKVVGSKSIFKPHNDGIFECIFLVRPTGVTGGGIIGSANAQGEKGIRISIVGPGASEGSIRVLLLSPSLGTGGAQFIAVVSDSVVTWGTTNIVSVRGDGTKLYVMVNREPEKSVSYTGGFDSGDMSADLRIGSDVGSNSPINSPAIQLGPQLLCAGGGALTATQRQAYLDDLEYYAHLKNNADGF